MKNVIAVVATSDGGRLSLSHDDDGYVLSRSVRQNGRYYVHTLRLSDEDLEDIPKLIVAIGRLM